MTRFLPLLLTLAGLAGCQHKIPVIDEAIPCDISKERLQEQCAAPTAIAAGASYADVINAAIQDRKSLRDCANHDRLVTQAIAACNDAIATYNGKIREINKKYAETP